MESLGDISKCEMPALLRSVRGHVWQLAKDVRYCRLLQHALEIVDEGDQVMLVYELRGFVVEATRDPHANHVLQKAIELMRPTVLGFVKDELMLFEMGTVELAKHRYGCRVLERVLEHFPPREIRDLLQPILNKALELMEHPFGNFVVQHILEHGDRSQQRQLVDIMCSSSEVLAWIAGHQYACSVLDKALSYASCDDQKMLAGKVLDVDGALVDMALLQRGGFAATERLFKVFEKDADKLREAKHQLGEQLQHILATKHGHLLIQEVAPELLEKTTDVVSMSEQTSGSLDHNWSGGCVLLAGGRASRAALRGRARYTARSQRRL